MHYKSFWLKAGLVLLILLLLISAGILRDIYLRTPQDTDTTPLKPVDTAQASYISKDTPLVQEIYYRQCRHLLREDATGQSGFAEKSFSELRGEGWQLSWSKAGLLTAFREEDQLCPEDAVKRHISIYEGELAVYAGPAGAEGEMLERLGVRVEDIDPKWQEMLLGGGIDFADNEALQNALENLDEF